VLRAHDLAALLGGDWGAVDVAEDVGLTFAHASGDAGEQGGREVADRGVVVAVGGHQAGVFCSELGVNAAGLVGGHEQGLAQEGVARLGQASVVFGSAGLVHLGDQPGVGPDRGEVSEAVDVSESPGDDRRGHRAKSWGGDDDAGGVGFGVVVRDPLVEVFDLLSQGGSLVGLNGDVGGEFGEVHPVRAPQFQGLAGSSEQGCGVVLPPCPAGVPDQETRQSCRSQAQEVAGIGIARQQREGALAVVRAQRIEPGRAEKLELRVQTLEYRGPAFDHRRSDLHRAAQGLCRPVSAMFVQPVRVKQRQPCEQPRIQPVVLGVFGVVGTQVRRLGGRHHHDPRTAATEPGRDRHPGVAGGLEDDGELVPTGHPQRRPQIFQLGRTGEELPSRPHERPISPRQRALMGRPAGQIDPQHVLRHKSSSV
jgi:hypothetical protein